MLDFFLNSFAGVFSLEFGGAKLAGGEVEGGEAHALAGLRDGGKEIVFLGTEGRIRRGTRRDYSGDFAPHQFLGQARVLDLLADRDLESLANQLRDIALGRMVRHATHGDGDAFFLVARGQRDLQFPGGEDRVVEEKFVEISQAEEQQRAGMLLLDGGILPHQRGGRLGHFNGLRARIITKAGLPFCAHNYIPEFSRLCVLCGISLRTSRFKILFDLRTDQPLNRKERKG